MTLVRSPQRMLKLPHPSDQSPTEEVLIAVLKRKSLPTRSTIPVQQSRTRLMSSRIVKSIVPFTTPNRAENNLFYFLKHLDENGALMLY